ncbi:MAG: nucleotidyltransferase domain-containing protein [Firmicutes bacterium]|nr:nucleotidyltransferase domain-containing protein [Bacillota bacterium]
MQSETPYNPLDNPVIKTVSQEICTAAKNTLGDKLDRVYLFGSYARGDYDEESNVDYMIVANLSQAEACRQDSPIHDQIHETAYELNLLVTPRVTSSEIFNRFSNEATIYRNVLAEGVKLYG